MAGPILQIPNMATVTFIFDNMWTVNQMENYLVSYQPGGISLFMLRRALGHGRYDMVTYARVLTKTAAIVYTVGHTKTVHQVLLELLLRTNPLQLTAEQVGLNEHSGGGAAVFMGNTRLFWFS
jgi:hypothetical protein